MPTPKQISLDLDKEVPVPVAIPPGCMPTLIDLMAQAIVTVWRSAQEVDHESHGLGIEDHGQALGAPGGGPSAAIIDPL